MLFFGSISIKNFQVKKSQLNFKYTSIMNSILPPEIISKIFEHLSRSERFTAAGVCRQWYDLAFGPKFCRELCIQLNSKKQGLTTFRESILWNRSRKASIRCDELNNDTKMLLKEFLENAPLEWFHIDGDSGLVQDLLVQKMPHLTHFSVYLHPNETQSGDVNFQIEFDSLKCLNLRAPLSNALTLDVNCPNLITVNMVVLNDDCISVITKLRKQLEGLEISVTSAVSLNQLAMKPFDKLITLALWVTPQAEELQQVLEQTPYLEDMYLNVGYSDTIVGGCFSSLKNLKTLSLVGIKIDAILFFGTMHKMTKLEKLSLERCSFVSEQTSQKMTVVSESITSFTLSNENENFVLPNFPNLEDLTFLYSCQPAVDVLGIICHQYTKLKRLNFGGNPGIISMFHQRTSIAYLNKLKLLNNIQFSRLSLQDYDWVSCGDLKIQKLRLVGCMIDGTGAQQIVQTFPELREFFIDNSYLRQPSEVFEIDENCTRGLRSFVPNCRVSYYDCHIEARYDMCAGRSLPVMEIYRNVY
ncbi:F-box/LRR-repeat protein fbxl-1-like [Wyeomyia smithii]|uniref:F-box/LRR-repeat protein fbxl-1-like n=1 Tax=Wyeomyia smithii TaxID=174621 RepID=UPI002467DB58|nr:F-box/LRR-repeat protein fbxl-1-like [Wyeomyia smithii]